MSYYTLDYAPQSSEIFLKRLLLALVAMLFMIPAIASAVTQCVSGTCLGCSPESPCDVMSWMMVISFDDDGNVVRREGISCQGNHWVDNCGTIQNTSGGSDTSDYHYGDVSAGWWVRYNVDGGGQITAMWGKTVNGQHWKESSGGLN